MPFNKLTEHDKTLINKYIECYALGYEDAPSNPRNTDMEYVLRFWHESKGEFLFNMFGGNLILEKEIEIAKTPEELENDVNKAFNTPTFYNFREKYFKGINELCGLYTDNWYNLYNAISTETLARNVYNYTWRSFSIELPKTKRTLKIAPGMKPMKILSKLAEEFDLIEEFEQFRIAHSMLLNQKSLTGTLCLSIHPLDYMTMSDNDCNWQSCMNWREPGEYRQGTVEMMNSNSVIVAYLKAKEPFIFSTAYNNNTKIEYAWNNKRWRTLIVANKYLTVNVKSYPYVSNELDCIVQEWVAELALKNLGINYIYDYEYDGENVISRNTKLSHIWFVNNCMYSDFGCLRNEANHKMKAINDNPLSWPSQMHYSGPTQCMWCGESVYSEDIEAGAVICNDCSNTVKCEFCGDRCSPDELYEVDGDMICRYCYENDTAYDPITDEEHYINSMTEIFLSPYNIGYAPVTPWRDASFRTLEPFDVRNEEAFKKYFVNGVESIHKAIVHYRYMTEEFFFVNIGDLTDAGYELFETCPENVEKYCINRDALFYYTPDTLVDFE